ncbi:hypothetical protein [Mesorhizobium sp. AR02]|uniref:hypothetical protein n=1 Tax=Mesorhizobium sp. AR02 TaxID=2865837 RepID=UPI0029621CF6|nr:hypothetical protein [Mesorhizobium sp. AR02]
MKTLLFAALASLVATTAHAAGLKFIQIPADAAGPAIDAAMWSPCASPASEAKIKGFLVAVVPDCPIAGEKLPLVIISHGYAAGISATTIRPRRWRMRVLSSLPSIIRTQTTPI